MDNLEIIKSLGLSDQEAEIYLALLKLGGSRASLVAKEVGMKRTTIYAILKSLAQKGLVTVFFRKNQRFYYAKKPHQVAKVFQGKINQFEEIIPVLESLEKKQTQAMGLRFIETVAELEDFYNDILEEYKNKEYCAIGNAGAWQGVSPEFFIEYRKRRGQANIKTRLMISAHQSEFSPSDKSMLRKVKVLPEKYIFKSTIDIFKDKILIVSPDMAALAVVIAIPAMVDVFQSMFDIMWEQN
jgi:sugar-specific transcriptional regulator TrmB